MPRPRRVYDPMTGALDYERSAPGAIPVEWIEGVVGLIGDKAYALDEDPFIAAGFSEHRLARGGVTIRGTRLA